MEGVQWSEWVVPPWVNNDEGLRTASYFLSNTNSYGIVYGMSNKMTRM